MLAIAALVPSDSDINVDLEARLPLELRTRPEVTTARSTEPDAPETFVFEHTSPVCGCDPSESTQWHGLTGVARDLELSRDGTSPLTQWRLSPGAPRATASGLTDGRVAEALVEVYAREGFAIAAISKGHIEPLSSRRILFESLPIITSGTLSVHMPGPVPVFAWIPRPGARVMLGKAPSPLPQRDPPLVIQEQALEGTDRTTTQDVLRTPVLDVIGSGIVFWSVDQASRVPGALTRTRKGEVLVVRVVRGAFSIRTEIGPLTGDEAHRLEAEENSDLTIYTNRTDGSRTPLIGVNLGGPHVRGPDDRGEPGRIESDELIPPWRYGSDDGGSVTLAASRPMSSAGYAEVRTAASADEVRETELRFWADLRRGELRITRKDGTRELRIPTIEYSLKTRQQRNVVPPLPERLGLNVFGPLEEMVFPRASGRVFIAGEERSVPTAAQVSIGHLREQATLDGQQYMSLPTRAGAATGRIQFRAKGSVYFDEEAQTMRWSNWSRMKNEWAVAALSLEVLAFILGVVAFVGGKSAVQRQMPSVEDRLVRGASRGARHPARQDKPKNPGESLSSRKVSHAAPRDESLDPGGSGSRGQRAAEPTVFVRNQDGSVTAFGSASPQGRSTDRRGGLPGPEGVSPGPGEGRVESGSDAQEALRPDGGTEKPS